MSQTIDLVAEGFTEEQLASLPVIYVSEYARGTDATNSDRYYVNFELRDESQLTLIGVNFGSREESVPLALDWRLFDATFADYPRAPRYIYIEHGTRDSTGSSNQSAGVISGVRAVVQGIACP